MSQRNSKAIVKYLNNYAEPESDALLKLAQNVSKPILQALVIPAYKESESFVERLLALPCSEQSHTLSLIILNGPQQIPNEEASQTLAPLRYLQTHTTLLQQLQPGIDVFAHQNHIIVTVDLIQHRASKWKEFGVGFARKLGMDMCLWLYHHRILINPFVRSSDADVIWPPRYLDAPAVDANTSAIIYPFQHGPVQPDDKSCCQAAALYDAWLRYYVEGLRWSGSPWSFHTIGSIFAVHLEHYAMNRGFPKREAGEDFYLLNKLAKTGVIHCPNSQPLLLSNRTSNRTPFGTGKSIHQIELNSLQSWHFYHPDIFQQLKYWYQHREQHHNCTELSLPEQATPIQEALQAMGIEKQLHHCRKAQTNKQNFIRQLDNKLDAFLTRKLVHWLRDHYFASLNFERLVTLIRSDQVPFLPPDEAITRPSDLANLLQKLN